MKILLIVSLLIPLILGSDNQSQQSGNQDQKSQQSGYQDQQSQQCSYQDQQSGQCQNPAKNAEIGILISAFAIKMYKQITALGPRTTKLEPKGFYENAICAPISIFQMYALVLQGAGSGSTTYKQIKQVLELNKFQNDKEINEAMLRLIEILNSKDRVSEISTGNAIFLGERSMLLKEFDAIMKKYKVDFNRVLFISPDILKQINGYITEHTNNKIPHFKIPLRQNTNMVMVNYFYFKGEWNEPFGVKGMTVDGEFKLIDGSIVKVPTMQVHGIFKTYWDKTLNCKVIEIPYKGSVSLIIVVPLGNIHRLGQSLTIETLKKWKTSMASSAVRLSLPKFSVNQQLDVKPILEQLGMEDVFTEKADLTRMFHGSNTPVSDSMHQALLDVTDAGTVASGSSNIITAEVTSPEFKVDVPFIFMVQDSKSSSILVIGRSTDPRKAQ